MQDRVILQAQMTAVCSFHLKFDMQRIRIFVSGAVESYATFMTAAASADCDIKLTDIEST